jgi:hypothetical protein
MEHAMSTHQIITIALLLAPILLIQLGMIVYSLIDLSHRKIVRGPRWAWAVGLILTAFEIPMGIIGSGVYLAWGRQTGLEADDDSD